MRKSGLFWQKSGLYTSREFDTNGAGSSLVGEDTASGVTRVPLSVRPWLSWGGGSFSRQGEGRWAAFRLSGP